MPNRLLLPLLSLVALVFGFVDRAAAADPPNIVVIFTDDQGYADVGCFGATGYETPNLDRMASEGMRLTDFYVAQAVCSASRSALLTGCYNVRVGITGALGPESPIGLNPNETTFAELAKSQGYATAMFGKWHLGHRDPFLPTNHGFDEYYGLPYSNDMWPWHPQNAQRKTKNGIGWPDLPMVAGTAAEGSRVVDPQVTPEEQTQLTTDYTEKAVAFIDRVAGREQREPFLLYLAHSMPHVPLFVSDKFAGSQPRGLYGDVIREIDWSVGQVLEALKRNGVDDNTFVVFTSDNGPWLNYGDHAGSAGPLREGKGTAFEGGVRVPCIAWMPGKIPAGTVCDQMACTIDLLPTIAGLIGAPLPDRTIDGRDLWGLLTAHPQAVSPHEALYFYWGHDLHAVRSGRWKLHFPHNYRHVVADGGGGQPGTQEYPTIEKSLFDLQSDIGETTDVKEEHPEVVERLQSLADGIREQLGDRRLKIEGSGVRPVGRVKAGE